MKNRGTQLSLFIKVHEYLFYAQHHAIRNCREHTICQCLSTKIAHENYNNKTSKVIWKTIDETKQKTKNTKKQANKNKTNFSILMFEIFIQQENFMGFYVNKKRKKRVYGPQKIRGKTLHFPYLIFINFSAHEFLFISKVSNLWEEN